MDEKELREYKIAIRTEQLALLKKARTHVESGLNHENGEKALDLAQALQIIIETENKLISEIKPPRSANAY